MAGLLVTPFLIAVLGRRESELIAASWEVEGKAGCYLAAAFVMAPGFYALVQSLDPAHISTAVRGGNAANIWKRFALL